MQALLETSEYFAGRNWELHLSPEGLALTRQGLTPTDPAYQSAPLTEVAGVELDLPHRRLVVVFHSSRPNWVIEKMIRPEAAWAEALLTQAVARARLYEDPGFRQALSPDALREAVAQLAAEQPPQPAVVADLLLAQAAWQGSTDLHLEPQEGEARALYRVDGTLREVARLPADLAERVVARLKVQAGMQPYRRSLPQTGGSSLSVDGRTVDLRLTSLPTVHGEKLTVRLLDPAQALLDLEALGMEAPLLAAWRELAERPQGCLLLTGPSGSGKTTTLYATLAHLRAQRPDLSLATIEEPVELRLAGVAQTEVNRAAGLDFAAGLRTLIRQDAQVLMVGEIRDAETAAIAMQAGLTGHRLLTTVHAPSAAAVFTRLMQLGTEPYVLASSVTAVLTQRLVRKVCSQCATPRTPSAEEWAAAGLVAPAGGSFRQGTGCEQCAGTGYRGRTGLFALLPVTAALREAVLARRPLPELEQAAAAGAVGSLWDAGIAKLREGVTTLEELRRVLGRRED